MNIILPVLIGVVVLLLAFIVYKLVKGNKKTTENIVDALKAIKSIFGEKFGTQSGVIFVFFLNAFEKVISQNLTEDEALTELVNLVTVAAHVGNITLTQGQLNIVREVSKLFFDRIGIKFFSPVQKQTAQLKAAIASVRKN